jgi:hypothetical protein
MLGGHGAGKPQKAQISHMLPLCLPGSARAPSSALFGGGDAMNGCILGFAEVAEPAVAALFRTGLEAIRL